METNIRNLIHFIIIFQCKKKLKPLKVRHDSHEMVVNVDN